jgi:protein-S-isoprenylcysteine O-methyltransferase Ste14
MRRPAAAAGSALFFVLAPGTVAGLLPWLITGRHAGAVPAAIRVLGVVLIVAGGAAVVSAFVRFVIEGLGTPAPVAAPERLVVGGLYRYVRNPMYVAVLSCVVGQALLFGRASLWIYALVVGAAMVAFVRLYEEPNLARKFGDDYAAYRRAVPGWRPRLRPWRGPDVK